jgi:hypothetical protein
MYMGKSNLYSLSINDNAHLEQFVVNRPPPHIIRQSKVPTLLDICGSQTRHMSKFCDHKKKNLPIFIFSETHKMLTYWYIKEMSSRRFPLFCKKKSVLVRYDKLLFSWMRNKFPSI